MKLPFRLPFRLLGCLLAGGAVGLNAAAQNPPASATGPEASSTASTAPAPSIPLTEAVDAAWQLALSRREAQGHRQRAQADQAAAAAPWASPPVLELGHRSDRLTQDRGDQESEIGLAWSLWQPGQRRAQAAAADADLAVADAAAALARWQVAGEVREVAWQVHLRQAERALAAARVQALAALADDVGRRVQAGDLARVDHLAAEAERLEAAAVLAEADQQEHTARAQWTLLTGLPQAPTLMPSPAPTESGPAPHAPAASEDADLAALVDHPARRLAGAQAEAARQRLDALRTNRRAAPELTLGLRQGRGERAEPTRHSLAIGLRLPLGTGDRNRPLEAAALAEADLAGAGEGRTRDRLAAEAAAARSAVQAATRQQAAQQARAALLRERARLIERSFRAGESPLPELLRALAAAAQADAALTRQRAALGLAQASHQQSLGVLP